MVIWFEMVMNINTPRFQLYSRVNNFSKLRVPENNIKALCILYFCYPCISIVFPPPRELSSPLQQKIFTSWIQKFFARFARNFKITSKISAALRADKVNYQFLPKKLLYPPAEKNFENSAGGGETILYLRMSTFITTIHFIH